jgi:hypothetical protein
LIVAETELLAQGILLISVGQHFIRVYVSMLRDPSLAKNGDQLAGATGDARRRSNLLFVFLFLPVALTFNLSLTSWYK